MPGKIKNLNRVVTKIRTESKRKENEFFEGCKKSMLYLLSQSLKEVPVDYGNLRASGGIAVVENTDKKFEIVVFYLASYAVFVHEDLTKVHGSAFNIKYAKELSEAKTLRRKRKGGTTGPFRHSRGENQKAKFLEDPWKKMVSEGKFTEIIENEMS